MFKQLIILLAIGTFAVSCHLESEQKSSVEQNGSPVKTFEQESKNVGLEVPEASKKENPLPVYYPDGYGPNRNQPRPPPRTPTPPTMPTINEDEELPDDTPIQAPAGRGRGRGRGRGNLVNRFTSFFRRQPAV